MKKKKFLVILLALIFILIASTILIKKFKLKTIDLVNIDVSKYITICDETSDNKVQVNWKDVCAIVGALNNNKFSKVEDKEIYDVAAMFVTENQGKFSLTPLKDVLTELGMDKEKISLVQTYISDLKYYGLTPEQTAPNTKYTNFIDSLTDSAIENYKKYKILPSITISQAILESSWGESRLSSEFNNLFGIKANSSWKGESVSLKTNEYYNKTIVDKFRKYNSPKESIDDHGQFLYNNKRYRNQGVFDANTYIYQAKALQDAGYSTIENDKGEQVYAEYLMKIIKQYNLQLIDSQCENN